MERVRESGASVDRGIGRGTFAGRYTGKMDIFKSPYYARSKKYLCFCGQWPYQLTRVKILHLGLIMLATATIFVPQLIKLYELRHNLHMFVVALPSLIYYAQFFFKNYFAALLQKKIKKVLEKIRYDFDTHKGEDLEILHEYSAKANYLNTFYTVYMFMAVAGYSMMPFTLYMLDILLPANETRLATKPRLMRYFVDQFDDNVLFMLSHGITVDLMSIVFIIGFDTLAFSIAYHACALFVITKKKMGAAINLKRQILESGEGSKNQNRFYGEIVETILLHKRALEFVVILEEAFSLLNFFSIGCAMVPLTITGFEVILNKDNFGEMIRFILFAFGEIIHLFYYNWPGQQIRDHSLLIYQSCYNSEWYEGCVTDNCKKLLNLMMLRSQKPCFLTAGKIYILGLENFAAVVKLSMSYFTVLTSVM